MTIDKLTKALTEAAEAHHVYEQANFPAGKTDPNWQAWYAAFIINKYGPFREPLQEADASTPGAYRVNHRWVA